MRHKYKEGFINYCQICNTKKIIPILDFGFQPLADDLLKEKNKNNETISYPIKLYLCKSCRLVQNNFIVGDRKLYNKNYHYRPGISKTVESNLFNLAVKLSKLYSLKKNDLIVDIGCSDGTLLYSFKKLGFQNVIGVEPTNTYKIAKKKGIFTINNFFNKKTSSQILKKFGKAKLITTTNVFAHTGELKEFILGVNKTLSINGIFVVENHYLKDIIEKVQFDSFYHEHLRTYSLKSLIKLLNYYKLNIVDAYTTERYNGNIQAHFSKNKSLKISNNVKLIMQKEKDAKLDYLNTYKKFSNKVEKAKKDLCNYINKNPNKTIIGKSYPARASVILNYFSFLKDRIKFIAEQPTSLKLNHYIAGTDIKIVDSKILKKNKPKIIIIFAWHLFKEIKNKWKSKGLPKNTRYILMLPKFKIFK
tara:strand:+ start:1944 stop:3197 length:1254 start_codon:yes stop_codon:yes gene_type:complete